MPTQYECLLEQGHLLAKQIRGRVLIRDGVLIRRRALIESLWYLTFQLGRSTPTFCGLLSPTGYKCVERTSVMPKPGGEDHAVTSCLARHTVQGVIPSFL